MLLDRDINNFIIREDSTVLEALRVIDDRKGRILIVVTERDVVKGVVTNGDILRWFINNPEPDLQQIISKVANKDYKFVYEDGNKILIKELLKEVLFVPVLNEQGQLVSVARREYPKEGIKINDKLIGGDNSATFIIAEIGNNHNGDIKLAKKLVDYCVLVGADCAKFQMRDLETLYLNAGNSDDVKENLGSQYTLDLLSRFQLTNEELLEVFDYCKTKGILPLCTPWDLKSLEVLEAYNMPAYKVASADLTNHELLFAIAKTGKPMICSTGMSTEKEIQQAVDLLQNQGVVYIMLHCNSTYPTPFGDINLNYLNRLKELSQSPIGYSGHERGINVSIAAVGLGAKVIERHITLDRLMEGSDHKASLLPDEFKAMVKGIREVEESLGKANERSLSQGEMMNRVTLAKSLVVNQTLKSGDVIEDYMLEVKSPGRGLQPNYRNKLIGRKAKHDFKAGDFFYPNDIEDSIVSRRAYKFKRPWGIPVRYYDFKELIKGTNMDFVEFHLSYKDLDIDFREFINKEYPIEFIVHSPELFAGDHILDLCSPEDEYREHSINELQRVINITRELNHFFPKTKKPLIVTNVGGRSQDGFLSSKERKKRYRILEKSLSEIDTEGVELIPQTMPPFPWHFGGQCYHNLFVDLVEIVEFCKKNKIRICLDTSHSKLACNHNKSSFYEFLKKTAPFFAHIHFGDSENTGGEGIRIGEGEIDFHAAAEVINKLSPTSSFIPEIWQGHENNGEGFWIALEKLEEYLN